VFTILLAYTVSSYFPSDLDRLKITDRCARIRRAVAAKDAGRSRPCGRGDGPVEYDSGSASTWPMLWRASPVLWHDDTNAANLHASMKTSRLERETPAASFLGRDTPLHKRVQEPAEGRRDPC